MLWKFFLIIGAGAYLTHAPDTSNRLFTQTGDEVATQLVETINTSQFSGRYSYIASLSEACDFLLKEINPRCPDQRAETSFNIADIRSQVDTTYSAVIVKTKSNEDLILHRLYYRGSSTRGRRLCNAPEGEPLKHKDQMHTQRPILYSDDFQLLDQIMQRFNALSETCGTTSTG